MPIGIQTDDTDTLGSVPTPKEPVPHQAQFYDDQDTLTVDIDELYQNIIQPIDATRSFLGTNPRESRCHTFYRMTGLPVVAPDGSGQFYSSGYDPNLNLDQVAQSKQANIAASVVADTAFTTQQLDPRENNTQRFYLPIFVSGTLNSTALALGSTFIRSFEKQLTDGIVFPAIDKGQEQQIGGRNQYVQAFYADVASQINQGNIPGLLTSRHYLRPFVTDPRITSGILPVKNTITAPFLYDRSQTKIIDNPNGASTYLKRPYIERVITTRVSNSLASSNVGNNQSASQPFINQIAANIQSSQSFTDQGLLSFTANQKAYYTSEILIFQRYFRLMRAVLQRLDDSIKTIEYVRANINWQPLPDTKLGPESGATLNQVSSSDGPRNADYQSRNPNYELDIIDAMSRNYIDTAQFDVGLTSGTDPGDFTFSNLDDTVFSALKTQTKSYQDQIDKLNRVRTNIGQDGISALRDIEIIMGEFSGLGLLDILAIQAALWVMPIQSLLGLIDQRAFARLKQRPDLTATTLTQNPIDQSMGDFDQNVSITLKLIQKYFDDLSEGDFSLIRQSS